MTTALKLDRCDDEKQARRDSRDAMIGRQVILALGHSSDLIQVQVRELWERRYRVNIYVGPDAISARVAHSYFLETDDDGNIIKSMPTIKRHYGSPTEAPSPISSAKEVTCE